MKNPTFSFTWNDFDLFVTITEWDTDTDECYVSGNEITNYSATSGIVELDCGKLGDSLLDKCLEAVKKTVAINSDELFELAVGECPDVAHQAIADFLG